MTSQDSCDHIPAHASSCHSAGIGSMFLLDRSSVELDWPNSTDLPRTSDCISWAVARLGGSGGSDNCLLSLQFLFMLTATWSSALEITTLVWIMELQEDWMLITVYHTCVLGLRAITSLPSVYARIQTLKRSVIGFSMTVSVAGWGFLYFLCVCVCLWLFSILWFSLTGKWKSIYSYGVH